MAVRSKAPAKRASRTTTPPAARFLAPAATAPKARTPVSGVPAIPARLVDGVAVVTDEPVLSGLSGKGKAVPLRIRRLTLADGRVKHGCAGTDDAGCVFVADKRGEVMAHRMREHPGVKASSRVGKSARVGKSGVEGVPMAMTLGELLDLARSSGEWGSMMDALVERAEAAEKRADEAEAAMKKLKAALSRAGFRLDERDE